MNTDELKRLAEAATPGPWKTDDPHIVYATVHDEIIYLANTSELDTTYKQCVNNAAYIAAASPAVVLELIQQLEAANRDAERMRAWDKIRGSEVGIPCACEFQDDGETIKKWCSAHAEYRKDAERYQELCNRIAESNVVESFGIRFVKEIPCERGGVMYFKDRDTISAAIDAAMKP